MNNNNKQHTHSNIFVRPWGNAYPLFVDVKK